MGGSSRSRRLAALVVAALGLLAIVPLALAAFPGGDPNESVRLNTPDDPRFDPCEPDNEGGAKCSNVYDQEFERFGFAPNGSENTALYRNAEGVARQREQNAKAGRNELGQLSGVSADRAWKRSTGRSDVEVAILDTGILWHEETLRRKIALNPQELPVPQREGGVDCQADDCDGDGAFTVDDFAKDPRVNAASGRDDEARADKVLDGSDLIAVFSDGSDSDGNGYPDDIAGWDFFDDDNDPYDASSYSSAEDHGTGRGEEAAQATNDGEGGTGLCPRCRIVPMRIWDTFVVDTNNFALASSYAADNSVEVVEAAIGGLSYTRFVRRAMRDAYRRGVFFAVVSSDLNTFDHNSPTTYDEAMMVQGTVADTQGLGQDASEVGAFLGQLGIPTSAPIGTWFRNSGTTQYGEHSHIAWPGVTGSQATGQASGGAGLLISYARQRGIALTPNEVKQLMTLTAEDVVPENTGGVGVPDPAQPGWDRHFGYGRPDLGLALERVAQNRIPPQALITSPAWFEPFELSRQARVDVAARLDARAGGYTYELQWAPGAEPANDAFRTIARGTRTGGFEGTLGTVDLAAVRAALDDREQGGAANDPTEPTQPPGDRDPNEPAFTVRVRVTDAAGNVGEDRKALFAYRDATLKGGWPKKDFGRGGEASHRMWDVDGDNALDVIQADSSGELKVLRADGRPVPSFNRGRSIVTRVATNVRATAPVFDRIAPPREPLRTPAIGDVDGDREADIVDAAGEHVYAWHMSGNPVAGFPVRVDPARSAIPLRTKRNHVKRGFLASPVLADVAGDPDLEIVITALDGHVYAWDGRGRPVPGFPAYPRDPRIEGGEIVTPPAVGNAVGAPGGRPEIVTPTNEFDGNPQAPGFPATPGDLQDFLRSGIVNLAAQAAGGSGRSYALDAAGKVLPGWPIKQNGIVPDALPLVAPSIEHVMGNLDDDPQQEIVGSVSTGDVQSFDGDGRQLTTYDPTPPRGEHVDKSRIINFFENPIVADLDGEPGLEVIKGGITLNQLVNIGIAVGQNLPYNHVVQAWNGRTGESLPAFPQVVEDFQFLSSPAVADASDAPGRELIVGTGLYLLRNINADGREGAGWPKFTGGWIYAVPALGDVDGDGKLEVAVQTREGSSLVWDTDRPACGGTNDQWWTSRHDERSTGSHGTDTRPPGTVRRLAARRLSGGRARVAFLAPGDDWLCGQAQRYTVVATTSTRTVARSAAVRGRRLGTFRLTAASGRGVSRTLRLPKGTTRVAVFAEDDAGNAGLARVVRTRAAPAKRRGDDRGPRRRGGDGERDRRSRAPAATTTDDGPGLPFTGRDLALVLLLGAVLLAAGLWLRRRSRSA